jgi:amino acid adenylation domain-containing protein
MVNLRAPETLADLVPRAASADSSALGVVGQTERLSWRDVDRRTRRLAAMLVQRGLERGARVAVVRPKNNESFESVHAILRAGGVVVPIDPAAPSVVARELLVEADVSAVIGESRNVTSVDPWSVRPNGLDCVIVTGETTDPRTIAWDDVINDEQLDDVGLPGIDPDDTAYIIFTSGSTGRPKGIEHTHRSGLAYALAAVEAHGVTSEDRVAGMSPLHFDMSTFELYAAPLAGACVVIMSEAVLRFPASFTERSEREGVTIWYTVPFLLRQVTDRGALDRRDLSTLRSIMYAGEPYPAGALGSLINALGHVRITNVYGPAEVNECTFHVVDRSRPVDEQPIGRPWKVAELRIVDEWGVEVAPGQPGELEVSATTVMRGYWKRPELTALVLRERTDGPPWYATGDIVVRDDDGMLWFRGRRDHQVKIRGVRLELEAVESVLADAPGVAHAVAAPSGPHGDADQVIAAVVPLAGVCLDLDEVRQWCRERLPSVAVPHHISIWSEFPATPSGKIDRVRVRAGVLSEGVPG